MIVDPDFLDHWRTGMVTDALGDPTAPMCILRLWAHCQERKSDTFAMPTRGLKAQCKFQGDAEAFEKALIEAGFIERYGENIKVSGWAEKNASLIAAWENGKGGGRPRKEKTQEKPMGNPEVTHGEPSENQSPTQVKPIREEKSREEVKTPTDVGVGPSKRPAKRCPASFSVTPEMLAWAADKFPIVDVDAATAKFRDHTFGNARTDWPATWRNWIRAEAEFKASRGVPAADLARTTVPSKPGKDPTLLEIERHSATAKPMSPEIRQALREAAERMRA